MVKAVVGANWGDEGKGKITDMLAEQADIIVRFQGGANAGHTIINDYGKFALHTLPSGVFYGCLLYTSAMVVFLLSLCGFRVMWIAGTMAWTRSLGHVMMCYPTSWLLGMLLMLLYVWKGKWMDL